MESMPPLIDKPTYTVAEVARLLGFCAKTVHRMFRDEAGVLVLERPRTKKQRRYVSIRIPRAVYLRVRERLTR